MNMLFRPMLAFSCCLIFGALVAAADDAPPNAALPRWIWANGNSEDREIQLTKTVDLPRSIQSAELRLAADFCRAGVTINGERVIAVAPYCQTQTLDATKLLRLGENAIAIQARPIPGPAAFSMSLVVQFQDGSRQVVVSDESWSDGKRQAADLGAVSPELWGAGRRGIELSPFENYEQWQQAKTDNQKKAAPKFWTAPGFEVTELRVAGVDEGSWISLAFGPQGRLTISREDQGLLRMTLNDAHNSVQRVESIAADLKECRGLAYDGEWLYANANNSLGLYRLQIDDQGQVQQQQLLRQFPGKTGHGRNDIALTRGPGPRWLYAIRGDSVELPKEDFLDHTSPLNETKRKGPGREGSLLRADLEGKHWELWSAGLRNPYGIALDSTGEAFTFDADNEFDMGTPWYRPTRILHLLRGGDTGYRESTGVFPPRFHDQPDHAPPLFDIGRSSPTSVMFGYDLNFPPPYQHALFALDWTYGRVIAVHLAPRGGTYRAAAELFLQGRPLNVTDVAAGPDGSMYLITGGRKTQSALYRVSYVGEKSPSVELGAHEQQAREFSARVRREQADLLQGMAGVKPNTSQLTTADPVLRHAARIALERRELDEWVDEVLKDEVLKDEAPNLWSLLAVARARRAQDVTSIVGLLLNNAPTDLELSEQFVWVRIAGLCLETSPDKKTAMKDLLVPRLLQLWKELTPGDKRHSELRVAPEGTSPELRRRVAWLLGDLGYDELPGLVGPHLLDSHQQEDQLAGLLATRNSLTGWTPEARRSQFRALNEMPRMIGGAGLPPFEKWLRPQILKTLTDAEKRGLADLIEPRTQTVTAEPLPPPRKHVQKWTLSDLQSLYADNAARGDANRGAIIFRDALCSRCHRVNLKGAAVGPDLTHVSRRFSRRDMLESIVQPSLSVAENFRLETILTESGQVYTGRIVAAGDYRSEKLTLALDPLQPDKIVELDKKEITEHRTLPVSPMPDGLLDTFTRDEIRDLLAYLERGGD